MKQWPLATMGPSWPCLRSKTRDFYTRSSTCVLSRCRQNLVGGDSLVKSNRENSSRDHRPHGKCSQQERLLDGKKLQSRQNQDVWSKLELLVLMLLATTRNRQSTLNLASVAARGFCRVLSRRTHQFLVCKRSEEPVAECSDFIATNS